MANYRRVNVADLAKTLDDIMQKFVDSTYTDVEVTCKDVANEIIADLNETSPVDTGKYAKNWRNKLETGSLYAKTIIYNYNYRLTHLLEFGHAKVKGGRTMYHDEEGKKHFTPGYKVYNDSTRPQPHIKPAQDKADELFIKLLKRRIEANK